MTAVAPAAGSLGSTRRRKPLRMNALLVVFASSLLLSSCTPASSASGSGSNNTSAGSPTVQNSSWPQPPALSGPDATLLLGQADVPKDWTPVPVSAPAGFRSFPCGVDVEPQPPQASGEVRFAASATGPLLVQYVRVQGHDRAKAVVDQLKSALKTCREFTVLYTADGNPRDVKVAVEPTSEFNDDPNVVVWKQTVNEGSEMRSYTAFAVKGDALVSLVMGGSPVPDANDPSFITEPLKTVMSR